MTNPITRRRALQLSGATLAGLGPLGLAPAFPQARPAGKQEIPADRLAEQKPRDITPLLLNPDGTAKEFSESELTPVSEIGVIYRNTDRKPPQVEFDPAKHKIRIRGNVMKWQGALGLADLQKLPSYTQITKLQCGSPKPSGVIKWSGVRFADVCRRLLETQPMCQYVMFIAADGYNTTEDISVAMHPQTILAWEMNGGPIPPVHGAPYRLVIPTRWGGRHIKAIEEIRFTATSFGVNNA
jgi:DMSO/TMAO reductase YedYZ molybdopterin-dependent catalytic subunit